MMKSNPQNILSKVKQKHFSPKHLAVTAVFMLLVTVVRTTPSAVV